jgi:hypothetical protein
LVVSGQIERMKSMNRVRQPVPGKCCAAARTMRVAGRAPAIRVIRM